MSKKTDPVLDAVLCNDRSALQQAIQEGCKLDHPDRGGRTPLANAVINREPEIVGVLLLAGANANAVDKQGLTPLHFAAQGHSLEITNLLLTAGAKVDSTDSFGNTPLFRAVFESRGRAELISVLLQAGANQHLKNNSDVSPRDLAASIANFDVLSFFPKR